MTCFSSISCGRAVLKMQRKGLWENLKSATLIVSRQVTSRGAPRDLLTVTLPSYCKCINRSNCAWTCHLLYSLYIASLFNNSYHRQERNIPWTTYPLQKTPEYPEVSRITKRTAPLGSKMVITSIISYTIMRMKFSKRPMFPNGNCGRGTGCSISTEQIIRLGYKRRLDTYREQLHTATVSYLPGTQCSTNKPNRNIIN